MKSLTAAFLISTFFTVVAFASLQRTESLGIGLLYFMFSFFVGSLMARRVHKLMSRNEAD